MIEDDFLRHTRETLALAETILQRFRGEWLPGDPESYRFYAGTTVDLVRSIRAEIDTYLGVGTETDLVVSIEGEVVFFGMTSAALIEHAIDALRRGLRTLIGILRPAANDNGDRVSLADRLSDLELVSLGPRHVQVYLDLPTYDGSHFSKEERRLRDDALALLFDALEWAADEGRPTPPSLEQLPRPTQLAVLGVVARLLPPQTGIVERIGYRRAAGSERPARAALLTRRTQQRLHDALQRLASGREAAVAEGVIRQIDLDAQTFVLRGRAEGLDDLPCEYGGELAETVKGLLGCRVRVGGLLGVSRLTGKSRLEAEAVAPVVPELVRPRQEVAATA